MGWCLSEQAYQRCLAKRILDRIFRLMAAGVVYITEPRGSKGAVAPAFLSSPPIQLASWINKGLDWGSVDEVRTLQSRIQSLIEKDIDLVNII